MAINPTVETRNLTLVLRKVNQIEDRVMQAGARGLARGLEHVTRIAQLQYLSGPRPARLDVLTGRLRNSITYKVNTLPGKGVVGRIGSNVKYAAYHEFGFRGQVPVSAHTRAVNVELFTTKKGGVQDPRRPIKDKLGNIIGFKDTNLQAALNRGLSFTAQNVKAHTRSVNYAGRPFVRPAVKKGFPTILKFVNEEVKAAV